jgi:hypothetical protein
MRDQVEFSGLRWPAARVTGHRLVPALATGFIDDEGRTEVPVISVTGQGQHYKVESAEGWWRDFAELQLADEHRTVSFVRRHGDPRGMLAVDRPIHTELWAPLLNRLRPAALCWERRDNLEISKFTATDEQVAYVVSTLLPEPAAWVKEEMGLAYRGLVPVPVAHELAGYLMASAISAIRRRISMRRCQYCCSWFELHRSEAVFCSPSCRAAHHNERTSPHGFDLARDHPQGHDPLASSLARAGRRREAPHGEAQFREPAGRQSPRKPHGRGTGASRRRRSPPPQHR